MKGVLFHQITIFDLNPPDKTASPAVVQLFKHLTWLRALHGTASFVFAIVPGLGLVMTHKPSGIFGATLLALFITAFTPSIGYIMGVWLYNTQHYVAAHRVVYATLLSPVLNLGFLVYVYTFVFNQ